MGAKIVFSAVAILIVTVFLFRAERLAYQIHVGERLRPGDSPPNFDIASYPNRPDSIVLKKCSDDPSSWTVLYKPDPTESFSFSLGGIVSQYFDEQTGAWRNYTKRGFPFRFHRVCTKDPASAGGNMLLTWSSKPKTPRARPTTTNLGDLFRTPGSTSKPKKPIERYEDVTEQGTTLHLQPGGTTGNIWVNRRQCLLFSTTNNTKVLADVSNRSNRVWFPYTPGYQFERHDSHVRFRLAKDRPATTLTIRRQKSSACGGRSGIYRE